ncbi:hypothetical protein MTIM_29480 [Mycobacterium timonense]|uniref:Uncharacterized protein n=1 Tax=Mycobacterium timonense TaxID=701043 RepID=A0A7I9Z864_9MYCO|nr:hypothetical protein MTIM_29480 [Mycobacterium timonense]
MIARIRDWSSRIVSTLKPWPPCLRLASGPASAAPSTTRVHDTASSAAAHHSGSLAHFVLCDTVFAPLWG